ncbi:MAG: hypothetical protein AAGD13_22210 [Pseudomonadota bacterium]
MRKPKAPVDPAPSLSNAAEPLDDGQLDGAAGGFKVEIEGVTIASYEPVTFEAGFQSDDELIKAERSSPDSSSRGKRRPD